MQVEYEALPAVMSIQEAIAAASFHPQFDRTIERGDVDAAFAGAGVACVVEGDARMAGQEHFYLEPHCNFVQPIESDEFLLVASTQVRLVPSKRAKALGRGLSCLDGRSMCARPAGRQQAPQAHSARSGRAAAQAGVQNQAARRRLWR